MSDSPFLILMLRLALNFNDPIECFAVFLKGKSSSGSKSVTPPQVLASLSS